MALIPTINLFTANTLSESAKVNQNNVAFQNGINNLDDRVTLVEIGNLTLSGNKTFSGSVTFNSLPTSSATPTTSSQLVTKTYADSLVTGLSLNSLTGILSIASGGTGQTTANAALNALLPTQTGNSGKFLKTGGSNSSWELVTKTDVGLGNVENTALSTWTGSGNITSVGTLLSGSIPNTLITGLGTLATQNGVAPSSTIVGINDTQTLTNKTFTSPVINGGSFVLASGVTASRPVTPSLGRLFLDTTINLPIWYDGSNWKDFAGNVV